MANRASTNQVEISILNASTYEMIEYIEKNKIEIDISELKQLEEEVKTTKHPKYSEYLEISKKVRLDLREKLNLPRH